MNNDYTAQALALLDSRYNEVKKHLDFVEVLINEKVDKLASTDKKVAFKIIHFDIDRDFTKTQLATTYLLLYNLIEAVMTQVIDAIHITIQNQNLSFEQLSDKLKNHYFSNFRKSLKDEKNHARTRKNLENEMGNIFGLIITGFRADRKALFKGNITSEIIVQCCEKYGFEIAEHDYSISKSGRCLQNIKDMRNELAHGSLSFMDCGHSCSIDELRNYTNEVYAYLHAVVLGIDQYITEEKYKETVVI